MILAFYHNKGSFAGFRPASEGAGARTGGRGKHTTGVFCIRIPLQKNLPPKNLRLLNFEPHPPRARSARNAFNPLAGIAFCPKKFWEN
ncbi:MAG: hypothetical protein Q7S08_04545 [bacterium]|nr:hypothetical protein [bacterium]